MLSGDRGCDVRVFHVIQERDVNSFGMQLCQRPVDCVRMMQCTW